jgi:hypothetical protein
MFAIVTSYYNPANRIIRHKNYLRFREKLGFPVFVIEAAFGDKPFEVSDAYHQVRCKNLMWQQYTLLNLAISLLPDKYTKVICVDADIMFCDSQWANIISEMLDDNHIIHGYSQVQHLGGYAAPARTTNGFVAFNSTNEGDISVKNNSGFVWGLQRDFIQQRRFYDYWLNGSSDRALGLALYGVMDHEYFDERMNAKMKAHYLRWAAKFHDTKFSYADLIIRHMWHGRRSYLKRWECFDHFDPEKDVRLNSEGVMEWATDKHNMHKCCESMCLHYEQGLLM